MSFGHWRRGRTWRTHAKDEPTGRVIEVRGTSGVGLLVVVDADGAAATPAAGGWALGVVVAGQTDESGTHLADGTPSETTSYAGVQIDGVVDVEAGAAVARGDAVMATADGKVVEHVAPGVVLGRALEPAAADGDHIAVKLGAA